MKRDKQEKILAALLLGLLVVLLIPLFVMAKYNVRSVDDYSYALMAEKVWLETHSVWKTLLYQMKNVAEMWHTWQGTYFSEWLTLSTIGIFGKNAYYMAPYLTLIPMIIGELAAAWAIFHKGLGAAKHQVLLAALPCMIVQIMLPPSIVEAYYWMCGSVMYTTIYGLGMLGIACLISFLLDDGENRKKTVLLCILLAVLTFMLAGSTYITSLYMLIVYVCAVCWCIYRKKRQWKGCAAYTVVYIALFLVSVCSPGAAARQSSAGEAMAPVAAILLSLKEAAVYLKTWTLPPVLLLMAVMIPVFWRIVAVKNFRYQWPLLVSIVSFGIYAAHFTPCLYALGIIGAYRVQNIYRFQMYVWLLGNELYWLGWFHHRYGEKWKQKLEQMRRTSSRSKIRENGIMLLIRKLPMTLIVGVLSMAGVGALFYYYGGSSIAAINVVRSLREGEAQAYYTQAQERLEILEDDTQLNVVLEPFTYKPTALFFWDLSTDPQSWENIAVAEYYGKESVALRKE